MLALYMYSSKNIFTPICLKNKQTKNKQLNFSRLKSERISFKLCCMYFYYAKFEISMTCKCFTTGTMQIKIMQMSLHIM